MPDLQFVPQGWFSSDFDLVRNGLHAGRLLFWGSNGELELSGKHWSIKSRGFLRPNYTAISNNVVLGEASPEGFFGETTRILAASQAWILQPEEWLSSAVQILKNGQATGQIRRDGIFTRCGRCRMDIPIEHELEAFFVWLTIKRWNDQASVT